jgi:hypothetical protein
MSQKVSLYMKLYMFSFGRFRQIVQVRFLADRRQLQIARANDIVPPVDGLCRVTADALAFFARRATSSPDSLPFARTGHAASR